VQKRTPKRFFSKKFYRMGFKSLLTLAVFIPLIGFSLRVEVFVKQNGEIFKVIENNGSVLKEKLNLKWKELPLFTHFEVKKTKDGVVIAWKGNFKRCLLVTNKGDFIKLTKNTLKIKPDKELKLIQIFPLGGDGKPGLPASVQLGG